MSLNKNEEKKSLDEQINFNTFDMQSSAFFNHQLSSKSSEYNVPKDPHEFNYDFLHKNQPQLSKISLETSPNKSRNSVDLTGGDALILKNKNNSSIINNDFYSKYHSNSAIVHNCGNFILKTDIKSSTNLANIGPQLSSNRKQTDNLLLKYYGANASFFRNNSGITKTYSLGEKYLNNLVDISSQSDEESADKQDDNQGDGIFFVTDGNRKPPVFNLNYINNNNTPTNGPSKPSFLNQNIINEEEANTEENANNSNSIFQKNISDNEFAENDKLNNLVDNLGDIKLGDDLQLQLQSSTQPKTSSTSNNNENFFENAKTLIQDQSGCRLLQKKIDENPEITDSLFDKLFYDIINMCTDSFGNYLIQKMLDTISFQKLEDFTKLISSKFSYIAISNFGTRVIQRLLEVFSKKGIESLKESFDMLNNLIIENIVQLSSDSNSSHIIIKYVNVIKYPHNIPLFDSVCKNFIPLCKDKHGCCVIQKCIEAGNKDQKEKLFSLSNEHCRELISDQFGNYVIQYVVELNNETINKFVVNVILNDLTALCKEKYASNVIEKFLYNKSSYSKTVIDTIIKNENVLHELILDQYGNYIIQRILMIIVGDARYKVIQSIVSWYEEIKGLPFGARLIAKLSERYSEFNAMVSNKFLYGMKYGPNNNNIGNVNFIQMNNYMFPGQDGMGMYMKMMRGSGGKKGNSHGGMNNFRPMGNNFQMANPYQYPPQFQPYGNFFVNKNMNGFNGQQFISGN